MGALLTDFGLVTTSIVNMASTVITFIVGAPLLLIPVAIGFMMGGVALVKSFK